jgi:hypothetical protein
MPIWLRVSIVAAIGYASSNAELLSFSQRGARMISKEERRTLKAEATLLRIPIFALAVKGSANLDGIEFRYARRRGDESVEVAIRTERDPQLPYPGPLSRRIHMACLSLVAERGFPFENPLTWTWRELCRRMGLPNSGRRDGEFKRAIRATWGLKIFGLERIDGRVRESWRRLYAECEFLNDRRGDGSAVDANRLWLAPWYLDSLNALHAAPVDYGLWKQLERVGPLASRLYEYLIPSFYKREVLELAYDRLASAMPVVAEARRSHAIRQFAPALEALGAEGIIARVDWDAMKGTGRPKLILARGPRLAPPGLASGPRCAGDVPEAADAAAQARIVAEFYRLLGKDVRPVRSDQAVARDLVAAAGEERTLRLLPEAVRRLKSRFRNAETMGALVRYFDEVLAEDEKRRDGDGRRAEAKARRDAEEARQIEDDRRRGAAWEALGEAEQAAVRAAVLAEQPMLRRYPSMLEAVCIDRAVPAGTAGGTGRRS